jgi:predicted esterase
MPEHPVLGWWLALVVGLAPLAAQTGPSQLSGQQGQFPVGEIVERIAVRSDTTQAYALYLPSDYRADRAWPVLYAMDPRGRALVPLQMLQAAAERYGYIVLSSYNTASDVESDPNLVALEAMIGDTETRLSPDLRRLYLLGFSGTARASWVLAYRLIGHVAGVIGFGAGLPHSLYLDLNVAQHGTPFAFYGAVGTSDFNYDEVWELDGRLDDFAIPHRIEYLEGPHTWPPEETFARALAWMEIEAMRVGLRSVDPALVDSLYASRVEEARMAEDRGDSLRAFLDYEEATRLFTDLREATTAHDGAARLRRSREVRDAIASHDRSVEKHWEYLTRLMEYLDEFHLLDESPDHDESIERLRLRELQAQAEDADDRYEALSARRRLENAFVHLSFYQPREYMKSAEPARALALLELADVIKPEQPFVCYSRAQALAQLRRVEKAVEALQCAARAGQLSTDRLESDPLLDPLRGHPAFRALVESLRSPAGR